SFLTPEQLAVDQVAQTVDGQQVYFLDACSGARRYADFHIIGQQQRRHGAAVATGQGNHQHIPVVGGLNGLHHVDGVAAGRDCQHHSALQAEGAILVGEHNFVEVDVGDGGDGGDVDGQGQGGQTGSLVLDAFNLLH